jgi:hypothetical protein
MLDDQGTGDNARDLAGQKLVFEAWEQRLHGRRFIAREDLDLSTMMSELAHVSVLACEDGALRFRLAGSGLRQAFGCESRGRQLADIDACNNEPAWEQASHRVLARLAPQFGRSRTTDGLVHYWMRLPMSSDGMIADLVLCHDRYLPADSLFDPDRAARAADLALRLDVVEICAA